MLLPPLSPALAHQLALHSQSTEKATTTGSRNQSIVPHLVALYRYLTTEVLDPQDGSSRFRNAQYEAEGVRGELEDLRTQIGSVAILTRALHEVCADIDAEHGSSGSSVGGLDMRLREVGVLMAEYLARYREYGEVNEVEDLLADEMDLFREEIGHLGNNVGDHIFELERTVKDAIMLLSAADTSSPAGVDIMTSSELPCAASTAAKAVSSKGPSETSSRTIRSVSTRHRHHDQRSIYNSTSGPSPTAKASDLLESHLTTHARYANDILPQRLHELTATLRTLLSTQTLLLRLQIRHLETFTHSTQSRHLTTHAQFLTTVAKGIALKARIMFLLDEKEVYAGEGVRDMLRNTYDEVSSEKADLVQREGQLRRLLGEYHHVRVNDNHHLHDDGLSADQDNSGGNINQREQLFRTLGAEYARVETEIEEVRKDIEQLEGKT